MKDKWTQYVVAAVILFFIVVGVLFAAYGARWSHSDEFGHFSYIKYIQRYHTLPNYLTPNDFWEAHQPPLYYLLNLPVILLTSRLSVPHQLFAAQVFNVALSAVTIWLWYLIFIEVWGLLPERHARWRAYGIALSTIIAGLWPMCVYVASGVNNDNGANLVGAGLILFLLRIKRYILIAPSKQGLIRLVCAGGLIAAALLTKTTLYGLVGVVCIAVIVRLWKLSCEQPTGRLKLFFSWAVFFCLVIAVLGGWFFIRNLVVVGDFFGWRNLHYINEMQYRDLGQWGNIVLWLTLLYKSTLGIFSAQYLHPYFVYRLFLICCGISVLGNMWFWWRSGPEYKAFRRRVLGLYGIVVVFVINVFVYSLTAFQPQGRYIFPALAGIVLFLIIGTVWAFSLFRLRYVMICAIAVLLFGLPLWEAWHLKFIQTTPQRLLADQAPVTLAKKGWYCEYCIMTKDTTNIQVTLVAPHRPRLYTFGGMRLDTTVYSQIRFEARSSYVNAIRFTPAYMEDNNFPAVYSGAIAIQPDGQFHSYIVSLPAVGPDIIVGLEVSFPQIPDRSAFVDAANLPGVELRNFTVQ